MAPALFGSGNKAQRFRLDGCFWMAITHTRHIAKYKEFNMFFTFRAAISQGSQGVNIYHYTRNVYYQVKQQNIVV